jgi:hypothetical protein
MKSFLSFDSDKAPALPKFHPEYLPGLNLFRGLGTVHSDDEYIETYREIIPIQPAFTETRYQRSRRCRSEEPTERRREK